MTTRTSSGSHACHFICETNPLFLKQMYYAFDSTWKKSSYARILNVHLSTGLGSRTWIWALVETWQDPIYNFVSFMVTFTNSFARVHIRDRVTKVFFSSLKYTNGCKVTCRVRRSIFYAPPICRLELAGSRGGDQRIRRPTRTSSR